MVLGADLIVFDLDGTLIDSSGDIAWAANMTLKSMGYGQLGPGEIKECIGWGIRPLLEKMMPEEPARRIDEAREVFLKFYGEHLVVNTRPYPGVVDTIEHFSGRDKKMAIVTNKPIGLTRKILDELRLASFFMEVLGGDSVEHKKPHPEPLLKVIKSAGVKVPRTVFVGDSSVDCEAGRGAGVEVIGAAYGFRGRRELEEAGCRHIIEEMAELKTVVE
ncbi:MAG: HAD-IA family hydrolase [Thermodesulfobacteriota bacterium]